MLVAAFPFLVSAAQTARVVPVDVNATPDNLFASATYLDDPKRSYDITDVSRGRASKAFTPFSRERLRDRVIAGWFRIAIRLAPRDTGKLAIQAELQSEIFDVYSPRGNGTYGVVHAGTLVPFADRDPISPDPVVPITSKLASGQPIYIYVKHNRFLWPTGNLFWVNTIRDITADYQDQRANDSFFGGLLFAVIVTNLFLGFYLRDRTFFAYVAAMMFHVLTQFTQSGTSWVLFWPHASVPYATSSAIFEALFFVSLALFWRSFLNRPARRPLIHWLLIGFIGLALVRFGLLLVLPQPGWLPYTDFPLAYGLIIITLVDAIAAARGGYRPARFLIVALAGLLFFWGIDYQIYWNDNRDGILGNILDNGIYYGIAWDALFLTFALADRIETAKRSMISAQQATLDAQTETVERLRERDVAMSRFLPREFLEHLGRASVVDLQLGDNVEREMTILFSDIRSFTTLSESMSPDQTFRFLNAYLRRAGPIIREHGGFIDKYIGDALMGLFPNEAHTAIDAAIAMQRSVAEYNREQARSGYPKIEIGVGLHRGRLMLGAIGESERIETTVIADAVNVAARTESLTKQFCAPVIVTEAVTRALAQPHEYRIRPLGEVVVYGASRGTAMFEVFDGDAPDLLLSKVRTLDDFTAGIGAFTAGAFVQARDAFTRVCEASPDDRTAHYFLERSAALTANAPAEPWDGRIRMDVK